MGLNLARQPMCCMPRARTSYQCPICYHIKYMGDDVTDSFMSTCSDMKLELRTMLQASAQHAKHVDASIKHCSALCGA